MIIARKLDDFISTCYTSCNADRAHRGFGSTVYQSHTFNAWYGSDDAFSQFAFGFRWSTVAGPTLRRESDRLDHFGMGVAKDHRAP